MNGRSVFAPVRVIEAVGDEHDALPHGRPPRFVQRISAYLVFYHLVLCRVD